MSIEQYHQSNVPATPAAGGTGANLIREAAAVMADAHALATAVASTQMIPKHFQGKPDECAAAMLYGASLGLDPMQSVKQIYVVHGQAALYARAMVALVLGSGHEVWTVESADESVTVGGRRKGSEHAEQATWTYERAKKAGYTNNEKYRTDPQAMLYSKAASEVCRKIAPDVLSGVYSVEEMQLERVTAEHVPNPTRGLGAVLNKTSREAGVGAPEAVDDAAGAVPPEPDVQPPTPEPDVSDAEVMLDPKSPLAKAMYAALRENGVDKPGATALYAEVTGREVQSSKELSETEARAVLDHLANTPEEQA